MIERHYPLVQANPLTHWTKPLTSPDGPADNHQGVLPRCCVDTQAGKQFSHKNGKVQTSGKGTHVGGRDSIRERGNCSEHMNVEAWGQISPTFKNPRDQQDKAPTELGPANCTPITSLFPLPDSPMAHLQLGPITDCKVYSRKRWCKKKASQDHRGPDTAKDSDVATKHQQLQKTADENRPSHFYPGGHYNTANT